MSVSLNESLFFAATPQSFFIQNIHRAFINSLSALLRVTGETGVPAVNLKSPVKLTRVFELGGNLCKHRQDVQIPQWKKEPTWDLKALAENRNVIHLNILSQYIQKDTWTQKWRQTGRYLDDDPYDKGQEDSNQNCTCDRSRDHDQVRLWRFTVLRQTWKWCCSLHSFKLHSHVTKLFCQ